jgi:uncharacterized protein (DUF58 family)
VHAWIRRVLVVLSLLALLFFAYLTAIPLAYSMLYFAVLLIVASWLWTRLGSSSLSIRRDAPKGAYEVGEDFIELLEVQNRAPIALPWVEVNDGAAIPGYSAGRAVSVRGRGSRKWRTHGRFSSRGRYRMGPTWVITGDPFGFFQRQVEIAPDSSVTVYPRLVDVSRFLPGASHSAGETIALGRFADAPPDAFGVRDYDPSDGFNRIHWPSTARLGRPMVKSFEKYEGTDLTVVLDLMQGVHFGRPPVSTLEYAVSLAASVAVAGLRRNQSVGLICNDASRTHITPGSGGLQLRRILDYLAEAQADGAGGLAQLLNGLAAIRGHQSVVVITPRAAGEWLDRLARADRGGGRRNTILHLEAESFGGPAQTVDTDALSLGEQLTWWSLGAGDEIFRRRRRPLRMAGEEPVPIAI